MAAPTITQIMSGIDVRLATITGLRHNAYRPDQANPPAAWVSLPNIEYHQAFADGMFKLEPIVTVIISKAVDRIDEAALAQYMDVAGAKSIKLAIEGDRTLGLATQIDCFVADGKEADIVFGDIHFYGAIFNLHVYSKGS